MKPTYEQICKAADTGDIQKLRDYVEQGSDLNEVEKEGNSLFEEILWNLYADEKSYKYKVLQTASGSLVPSSPLWC